MGLLKTNSGDQTQIAVLTASELLETLMGGNENVEDREMFQVEAKTWAAFLGNHGTDFF